MRISDWSSDVCSSDLSRTRLRIGTQRRRRGRQCLGVGAQRGGVGAGGVGIAAERRSADLRRLAVRADGGCAVGTGQRVAAGSKRAFAIDRGVVRSEEHTSELQSLMRNTYDVLCLKKQNTIYKEQ